MKKLTRTSKRSIALMLSAILLAACNGSSDTGSNPANNQTSNADKLQRADTNAALQDAADSMWELENLNDAAQEPSNDSKEVQLNRLARASDSTLNYTYIPAPQPPVSRAGQLLNLPDPKNIARFNVTDRKWGTAVGEVSISMWHQDKLAAFSLSIDDNHVKDHPFWFDLAEQYGWQWTWFLITNQIGWGSHDHWGHWQKALDKKHDIQSHTYSHLCDALFYTYREYRQSQAVINQNLKHAKVMTMAYPFGVNTNKKGSPCEDLDTERTSNSRNEAAKHFLAARDVYGALSHPAKIDFMKVPSVSAARNFFNANAHWAYFDSVLEPSSRHYRTWYSAHFHGLYSETAKDYVRQVLAHIKTKEADVWVGSFTHVAQYAQEYATARLENLQSSATGVQFHLKDGMNDDWFDYPLTLKIRLPDLWQGNLNATQDNLPITATRVTHNGNTYAVIEAIPDRGLVEVLF
jgi:hypothetical protein